MKTYKEIVILIAEDDDGHAELIKEGLEESGVCNQMIRFSNGEEVWQFFTRTDGHPIHDKRKNYLLLLDLHMPKMDGLDVLKNMKSNENLKDIPIMILTTTDDPREVEACYKIGCNMYITKPVDFIKFTETLRRLGLFLQVVKI